MANIASKTRALCTCNRHPSNEIMDQYSEIIREGTKIGKGIFGFSRRPLGNDEAWIPI